MVKQKIRPGNEDYLGNRHSRSGPKLDNDSEYSNIRYTIIAFPVPIIMRIAKVLKAMDTLCGETFLQNCFVPF